MDELEVQRSELADVEASIENAKLAQSSKPVPSIEPIKVYWEAIDKLHQFIADNVAKSSAMTILRSLIDDIVVGGPDDDPEHVTLSEDAGFLIENIQALKAENPTMMMVRGFLCFQWLRG